MAGSERKGSRPRSANRKEKKRAQPSTHRLAEGSRQQFTVARGKRLEVVEFHTTPGHHVLSVLFEDKTSLEFAIDTSFSLQPVYSDWKTGNERRIKTWPRLQSVADSGAS